MAIWITSDLHFYHNQPFLYEPRGFKNVYEMNLGIVSRINSVVDDNDDLWILGDLMLNNTDEGIELMKKLKGHLHIVYGNHDTDARIKRYQEELPNATCHGFGARLRYGKYHFYLSHYPTLMSNFDAEEPLAKQIINLCGHSHTQNWNYDLDKGLIFHVELDTNDCYPWNLDDIIDFLKEYKSKQPISE